MESLLKDLIGFHFTAKWKLFFPHIVVAGEASGEKLDFQLEKWALFFEFIKIGCIKFL